MTPFPSSFPFCAFIKAFLYGLQSPRLIFLHTYTSILSCKCPSRIFLALCAPPGVFPVVRTAHTTRHSGFCWKHHVGADLSSDRKTERGALSLGVTAHCFRKLPLIKQGGRYFPCHELIQSSVSLGIHSGVQALLQFPMHEEWVSGLALSRTPSKRGNHPTDETEFMDWLTCRQGASGSAGVCSLGCKKAIIIIKFILWKSQNNHRHDNN